MIRKIAQYRNKWNLFSAHGTGKGRQARSAADPGPRAFLMRRPARGILLLTQHAGRAASRSDCIFPARSKAAAAVLLLAAFFVGRMAAAVRPQNEAVTASAEGNWGLSFQEEGEPPVANASYEELAQYDAWYAEITDEKIIYLTFDCGYENGNTAAILDALKKHDVSATFFVVGNFLTEAPELANRMLAEGHTVGNHTQHHPDMSQISDRESFREELTGLEELFAEVTGQTLSKYYRPPQGKYSEANLKMAQELGYQTFFWSLAYVDWYQDDQPTKEEAFEKLLGRIHPGAIVLLHSTSSTNASILDELLTKWEEMGYTFGKLSDLER